MTPIVCERKNQQQLILFSIECVVKNNSLVSGQFKFSRFRLIFSSSDYLELSRSSFAELHY